MYRKIRYTDIDPLLPATAMEITEKLQPLHVRPRWSLYEAVSTRLREGHKHGIYKRTRFGATSWLYHRAGAEPPRVENYDI